MKYCRINLSKTNYKPLTDSLIFIDPPCEKLQDIYKSYCQYKKFDSVMPLFDSQFNDTNNDCYGYTNSNKELVAFSLVKRHDSNHAESLQFAWDYADPTLRLGIVSLQHECAIYKMQGFKYLYLGLADEYKSQFDGFEILGTL